MKNAIIASILLLSLTAKAVDSNGGSDIGSGNESIKKGSARLFLLKTIFELSEKDLGQLAQATEEGAERYKSLGFFDLAGKNNLIRENCANIQANNAATASFMVEIAGAKEDAEVHVDDEVAKQITEATHLYFSELKKADKSCRNIKKSAAHLRSAQQYVGKINALFKKIDNGILDIGNR